MLNMNIKLQRERILFEVLNHRIRMSMIFTGFNMYFSFSQRNNICLNRKLTKNLLLVG